MNKETLYELRSLVALYPYYQPARLLMLRNMYLLHDASFDEELRRASIYIADRHVLFNLAEASHYHTHYTADPKPTPQDGTKRSTLSIIDSYLDTAPTDISEKDSKDCLLYTSPSPRDRQKSRMPSSA